MRYGTDEQKEYFLPKILAGELHFSIGYSEPGSGTDLASLKTKARPRGRRVGHQRPEDVDLAHPVRRLDLAGLPHRPRPAAPQGPLDDPGARPTPPASPTRRCTRSPASRTSATYYEDVRVPVGNLVGELNGGWSLMTNQLNHERVALTSSAPLTHVVELVARVGAGDQEPRRQPGDRLRVGADRARPGARPGRDAHPAQLEARRRRRPATSPPPRRRPPRSTAPSWPPRSTAR